MRQADLGDVDDREIPVVGLAAAFIFAAQMINFPVANGTSGHLLGGVLAAVLVGPWAGALAVTVVLVVQALLFADGGLSALGLNVVNMALAGVRRLRRVLGCDEVRQPNGGGHDRRQVSPRSSVPIIARWCSPWSTPSAETTPIGADGRDGDDRRAHADRYR